MLHQSSTSEITFAGDQNGARELRLKEAISVLLDLSATVARAYLTRTSRNGVALGLVTRDKKESGALALQMDRLFGALFNTEARLDIVFLDDESDARIRKTCPPFYHYRARYH